ncbi:MULTISPECIES: helix-turn-helix domain-containing protein [unclassified Beijerinckia]|uniref:TetR/AcrR family transcriptional regulator n=1 Tax=unclassified Beijerinckia TaxID=2638183 RepID=UPI000898EF89|nr:MULTISPECIES: helix-turn-helix domain-containing protein [unclassified Beijerinckia]MDH7794021.1 AcrR family transcriptional regulator [Beijerinckia sp. GAS462]SEB51614.1 transcriptional regulator, TetR family [Beijerinckia sp. 28-YEA-48]
MNGGAKDGQPPIGLRERRKAEKLAAIRGAARHLFTTHGFHETPMREVARIADVGFGTVSAYASDKVGLAAMLFVEDLDQLNDLFTTIDPTGPLLDQVIANFSRTFRFWATKPELSRVVLPKLGNADNPYVEKIMQRRATMRAALIAWLYQFKQHGVIASGCNLEQAAELLFTLYIGCVNEWLGAGETVIESGIERMRYLMEIPVLAFQHLETVSTVPNARKTRGRDR